MNDGDLVCVNHPGSHTRIRCSSCDSPICVQCMNQSAVGMKCPRCSQLELSPRSRRSSRRRNLAGASGLVVASLMGFGSAASFGFPGYLTAAIVGVVTGFLVRWIGRKQAGLGGPAALAAVCGLALGLLAVGAPWVFLLSPVFWIPGAIAAGSAGFVASR